MQLHSYKPFDRFRNKSQSLNGKPVTMSIQPPPASGIYNGPSAEEVASTGRFTRSNISSKMTLILPILVIVAGFFMMPSYQMTGVFSSSGVIIGSSFIALSWALLQFFLIARIPVQSYSANLDSAMGSIDRTAQNTQRLNEIYEAIYEGAESFLRAEYTVCIYFIVFFAAVILILVTWGTGWDVVRGLFTTLSFLFGAATSMASGYLGMKVAVFSNVRTTISAQQPGWTAWYEFIGGH